MPLPGHLAMEAHSNAQQSTNTSHTRSKITNDLNSKAKNQIGSSHSNNTKNQYVLLFGKGFRFGEDEVSKMLFKKSMTLIKFIYNLASLFIDHHYQQHLSIMHSTA